MSRERSNMTLLQVRDAPGIKCIGCGQILSISASMAFPDGTATPSELCGACHQAIYKEHSEGFGSDLHWADMKNYPSSEPAVAILKGVSRGTARSTTAHAAAGNDPWPLDAVKV